MKTATLFFLLCPVFLAAQDILVLNSGDTVRGSVLRVDEQFYYMKKADKSEISIKKSEVSKYKYGFQDEYNVVKSAPKLDTIVLVSGDTLAGAIQSADTHSYNIKTKGDEKGIDVLYSNISKYKLSHQKEFQAIEPKPVIEPEVLNFDKAGDNLISSAKNLSASIVVSFAGAALAGIIIAFGSPIIAGVALAVSGVVSLAIKISAINKIKTAGIILKENNL